MADFTAGKVEYDPAAIERERSAWHAPLDYAWMLAGPGALAGRGARAAILAPGAAQSARQSAIVNALRNVRKINKPDEVVERMFMP